MQLVVDNNPPSLSIVGNEQALLLDDITQHLPDMVDALRRLVAIPSWLQSGDVATPFGAGVQMCLDETLRMAAEMGFRTHKDVDGYYGWAEIGQGEELIGLLCHVDASPAPDEAAWFSSPLELTERNGLLYGLGSQQCKGPLIAVLTAVAALARHTSVLRRLIRIIVGTDAGTLARCMVRYAAQEEIPLFSLAPTGHGELVRGEKRILQAYLLGPGSSELSLHCGGELGLVPNRASYSGKHQKMLRKQLDLYGYPWLEEHDGTVVLGQAASSGACADQGINAITRLCRALNAIGYCHPALGFCSLIVGEDPRVRALLGRIEDISGSLSLNLASLHMDETGSRIGIDIRIPVYLPYESFAVQIRQSLAQLGWQFVEALHKEPLDITVADEVLAMLAESCYQVTGNQCEPIFSAEISYARALPNCIPFGALLSGFTDTRGLVNEHINCENLIMTAQIYALALGNLQNSPLQPVLGRQK